MTDDLEPLRRARPDRLLPDDPPDPETLAREKARLMSAITGPDGAELSDRWQDALVMKDMIRALWQRIVDEDTGGATRQGPKLRSAT